MRKKAKRTHSHVLCNFIEILYVFWAKFIAKFIFPWRVPSLLCLCIDLLLLIRSWNELKEGQAFHMNFISCFSDIWIGKEGWLRAKSVKITNISPYETNNTALFPTWEGQHNTFVVLPLVWGSYRSDQSNPILLF